MKIKFFCAAATVTNDGCGSQETSTMISRLDALNTSHESVDHGRRFVTPFASLTLVQAYVLNLGGYEW